MANQFQLVASRLFELTKIFRHHGDSETLGFKLLAVEPGLLDLPGYENRIEELRSEWYDLTDEDLRLLDESEYISLRLLEELIAHEDRNRPEGEKR